VSEFLVWFVDLVLETSHPSHVERLRGLLKSTLEQRMLFFQGVGPLCCGLGGLLFNLLYFLLH
jgi:hypothetical protein